MASPSSRRSISGARLLTKLLGCFTLVAALLLSAGCGGEMAADREDIAVIVTVQGLMPDVNSLEVSAVFNGAPAKNTQLIQKTLNQFVVYLPKDSSGALALSATALAVDQCKIGSGLARLDVMPVSPFVYQLDLPLVPALGKTCTVTVEKTGLGTVVSTPPGINCDTATTCSADFPTGTQVSLAATPSPKSLGISWSGACTGSAACMVTANTRQLVQANFAARICSPDSWCWYNALPQGNFTLGIWGTAANNIWTVGYGGTFLRYDGSSWQVVPSAATQDLFAIRGTSASDIWAVGRSGELWHYNGTSWSKSGQSGAITTVNLNAVWGSAPNDYYAVGRTGTIIHFDGTAWSLSTVGTQDLTAVFGFASNDVWAVGDNGTLLHYNGTAWAASAQSGVLTTEYLTSIWGSASNDIWAGGWNNTLLHYDGSTWQSVTLGTPSFSIDVMWGSGKDDVFAGGSVPGQIIHYNGSTWQVVTQTLFTGGSGPTGIWGSAPNNVFIIGSLELGRYDGTAVTTLSSKITGNILGGLWGSGANDVWAVGQFGTLAHSNGGAFTLHAQSGVVTTNYLYALWGSSATNAWAVGASGTLLNWNSVNWTVVPVVPAITQSLFSIWGANAANIWAVGQGNRIVRWNNTNWTSDTASGTFGAQNLIGIWGSSSGDIWSVGTNGIIIHYNGSMWTQTHAPTTLTSNNLFAVWGSSGTDIWAVGQLATILHNSGSGWSVHTQSSDFALSPQLSTLFSLWGSGPNDVWAVGAAGTILHFDGTTWSPKSSSAPSYTLNSVWGPNGVNGADVWTVGVGGSILRNQK